MYTAVVCRQLGYEYGTPSYNGGGREYGLRVWLDDVACSGSEIRLDRCRHATWGVENCNNENVNIVCHLDECQSENGGCSHQCNNGDKTGYICSCPDTALLLASDQRTCYSPYASILCTSDSITVSLDKTGLAGLRAEYLQLDGPGLELEHGGHVYKPGGPALVVDPGAPLTVRLALNESHPDLQAFATNCQATSTPDTGDPASQYHLIQDGGIRRDQPATFMEKHHVQVAEKDDKL
nr:hypothetical protein BaRGS_031854 [Batillaria attramentaria]